MQERNFTPRGQVYQEWTPYFDGGTQYKTTFTYDALDRPILKTNPDGTSVSTAYNLPPVALIDMLETVVTDEVGRVKKATFDSHSKMLTSTRMKGASAVTTKYQYDRLDRNIKIIDPLLNQWTFGYDGLGRRLSSADPDLGTWTATYDLAGRMLTQTDAKSQVTTLSYDTMSRVLSKVVTGPGVATETTTNTYDEARAGFYSVGAQTTINRSVPVNGALPAVNITKQYNFDLAGRGVQQSHLAVNGATRVMNAEYWPDGSLKRKQSSDGVWSGQYSYDLGGLLFAIDNAAVTSSSEPDWYISAIQYNGRGQATSVGYGNGVSESYTYNDWTCHGMVPHPVLV
jgi:YD repeat-containing protein